MRQQQQQKQQQQSKKHLKQMKRKKKLKHKIAQLLKSKPLLLTKQRRQGSLEILPNVTPPVESELRVGDSTVRQQTPSSYLPLPLLRYRLVASESADPANLQQQQRHRATAPSRKSATPTRRLEVLDFNGEPVPTLGRLRLAVEPAEESRMRWQHLCLICHAQLPSTERLYAHMEAHSLTLHRATKQLLGQRIRCCLCLELLQTWKRFRTHMQRHTGYQPFRCGQCAETFSTNGNLKRHLGRKHSALFALAGSDSEGPFD